ncbi:MAG: cytochrome o ubiquinol oxidase subunit III [Sulfobacillus benefaciens]|jgi:cytochrome aa3-600 menaquinol oxidase subunit 3|uniref:Cytochrome o ubiquinol oxidase subunit III n=1 Tax=Sulfobacillus benefaciens TaxID=453960 RepID=A0A2T2WTR3_9FIRM|nr:MAG: cytochrome o ubiquinol oxidase subunit III [Sulfobacillus benefaciens]HBQ96656.1 cytochrome o ubiquinol oxidase subunit III [Sulfobacillus sp.]
MSQAVRHLELPEQQLPLEFADYHESIKVTGFWIFLTTDLVLFACLFATFAVMRYDFANGPTPIHLFHMGPLILETALLLTSSFTCSLAIYQSRAQNKTGVLSWLILTILLGIGFVGTEVHEFISYVGLGATWHKSGFLSAFFTLVGTHGSHVTFGIFWALTLVVQLVKRGITPRTSRKLYTFALYWHFLDIVWVFIFSFVYLVSMTGGKMA